MRYYFNPHQLIVQEMDDNYYAILYTGAIDGLCYKTSDMRHRSLTSHRTIPASKLKHGIYMFRIGCLCRLYFQEVKEYLEPPVLCVQPWPNSKGVFHAFKHIPHEWLNITRLDQIVAMTVYNEHITYKHQLTNKYEPMLNWNISMVNATNSTNVLRHLHENIVMYNPFDSTSSDVQQRSLIELC